MLELVVKTHTHTIFPPLSLSLLKVYSLHSNQNNPSEKQVR